MKIYLKTTVYASKDVPDFASGEELDKEIEAFKNQMENDIFDLGSADEPYDAGYDELISVEAKDVPDYVPIKGD